MIPSSGLGLLLAEIGLLTGGAVVARTLLRHQLSADEIPMVLRHRIAMTDRFHPLLWVMSGALCLAGLGVYLLD